MGCGCSMHKSRIAAAQKINEQPTNVEAIQDAGPKTPETITKKQFGTPTTPPQKRRHSFLHGMSPLTSPDEASPCESVNVAQGMAGTTRGPIAPEPKVAVTATVSLSPAVLLAGSHDVVGRFVPGACGADCDGSVSRMAPSSEGGVVRDPAELQDGRTRGIERLGPGEARLPRFSRQDSLPHIVPSARGSADLASLVSKGSTLGPGLDFAFREGPTLIGPVAAIPSISDAGKVIGTGGVIPSGAVGSVHEGSAGDVQPKLSSHLSNEELLITPVTPEDALEEDLVSERRIRVDGWPQDEKGVKSVAATREHDDRTPPSQEGRPALAAGIAEDTESTKNGGRGGLTIVGYSRHGDSDIVAADGMPDSSDAGETWAATSGAYSLLDAEEEDFMETLLMDR